MKISNYIRYPLAIFLLIIIVVTIYIMATNWKLMWEKKKILTYYSGCKEVYIDNILVEGNCTMERQRIKEMEDNKQWWLNQPMLNVTLP